jgi:UMF1 family MFS transporter
MREEPASGSRGPAPVAGLVAWALYDWANSSYAAVVQTFVFAAYFAREVAVDATAAASQWGLATGLAGLVVAAGAPVLGAIVDRGGRRTPWIAGSTGAWVAATALLWFARPDPAWAVPALALYVLATLGYEFAAVFYNAMLPDLAAPARVGRWSGWGWAAGYAGGLGCLILVLFALVRPVPPPFGLDRAAAEHVRAAFPLVALWLAVFALPLVVLTPDARGPRRPLGRAVREGLAQLAQSIRRARRYAHIVRFLVAHMLYADALTTLFAFGGVYATSTFDMDAAGVLYFGIALNVTAGIGAAGFAWADDALGPKPTILIALAALIVCSGAILLATSVTAFWVFGALLGVFVGPVQAASRSYLAHAAPPALRTEMFGLYALAGKSTAFVGPLLAGSITAATASQRAGLSVVVLLFALGFALMLGVPALTAPGARAPEEQA